MNVFGVGPAELIVILIVALVFVGPERLPRLAAELARTIREIRKYTNSLASEFNEVVAELEKETEAERSEWKEVGQGLSDASRDLTDAAKSVSGTLTDAQADAAGTTTSNGAAAPRSDAPTLNGATHAPTPPPVPADEPR